MKFLLPDQFATTSVYGLLTAASEGRVGVDHRFLHAILDRGESAIPDLLRFGMEDRNNDLVIMDDVIVDIFRALKTPEAIPFYVNQLRRYPEEMDDVLIDALAPWQEQSVEPLLQLYEELGEEQGGDVAFLLAATRVRDERILKILLERLEYDASDGALALGLYGDEKARDPLKKLLSELGPQDGQLKREIHDALDHLGESAEHELAEYDIWSEYPEVEGPDFMVFSEEERIEYLKSPSAQERADAARSLGQKDLSEASRAALLKLGKDDPDADVRAACWEAFGGEEKDKDLKALLLSRLRDNAVPELERCAALVALADEIKEDQEIRSFAEEFYVSESTRASALKAMWRSFDRRFIEYFPLHLDDEDVEVKRQAILGIGYLGIYDAAERLTKLFDDEELRMTALHGYALAIRAEISRGRIRSVYRRIEEAAGGLSEDETQLVEFALDERLMLHGHKPVFFAGEAEEEEGETVSVAAGKTGRNDPCPCGSGKKYKRCCGTVQ